MSRAWLPICALALLCGCGARRADTIVVGSKNFSEQALLGVGIKARHVVIVGHGVHHREDGGFVGGRGGAKCKPRIGHTSPLNHVCLAWFCKIL